MRLLLVHGWGFDASLWDGIADRLDGFEIVRAEFGFLGAPPHLPTVERDMLCAGHSLGVLWLLHEGRKMRGLVSINGFDRFQGQTAALRAMRARLRRDPAQLVADFRRNAGHDASAPASFDAERLREGLAWLSDWDCREARTTLGCPMLALAAQDDRIAPPDLTRENWGDAAVWSERGGHVLPMSRPDWCAQQIRDFAHAIGAQ